MSLTNPKNVITEERLAEFYQSILPYLGGMPDVLANKFNQSDLYSEDEKIIGRWIDGKPLYQKVVNTGALPSVATTKTVPHGINNIETVISVEGIAKNTNGTHTPLVWTSTSAFSDAISTNCDSTNVNINVGKDRSAWTSSYVTIQYTKTSDSPIAIGSDTDYSTTEKIVGTWVDGKPLYQKTINFGTLPNSGTKDVNHNIANVKHIWITGGFAESSVNGYTNQLNLPSGSGFVGWYFAVDKTKVQCATQSDRSAYSTCYVTIQYTKTTD